MTSHNTFLQKYTFFFIHKRVEVGCQWEREGETGRRRTLTQTSEDYYIDIFLTLVLIPHLGPYILSSQTRGSQSGFAVGHCSSSGAQGVFCLDLIVVPTGWTWPCLTVCLWFPCIYDSITPTHSSDSRDLLPLVNPCGLSSCLHNEHPVQEIPDWPFCQRSICNDRRSILSGV